MSFHMVIDLFVPDQETPNALTDPQQEVIDRFRRDIVGAQSASVTISDDSGYNEKVFDCGSVPRADSVSAQVETIDDA